MNMAENRLKTDQALRRPIAKGGPITYWQIGATHETPYDVPDQPMLGEMDPFFFLTKHKNFIPHEYPCRTQFIADFRGKKPTILGTFAPDRYWLPFGSPRVDLSGFWFRPTRIGSWAQTVVNAKTAGTVRFRLSTCGGAVLIVNGREAGWMAPYGRNLETAEIFEAELVAGENTLSIYFDDLAERDARYFFQLDLVDGPEAEIALPVPVDGAIAGALEAALADMHFERPSYQAGEVALLTGAVLPVGAQVTISVGGDFMSIDAPLVFRTKLAAGGRRVLIADTDALPADFRHFTVSLNAGGFTASRVFGVEICHVARQGAAPTELAARIGEALDAVATDAEPDSVRALARLATGRAGSETDATILGTLPSITGCHDCADFILVPLLWCRTVYADAISADVVAKIDEAILNYRYWMDEPGNDVQWYFSENHALLFHTAAYLAGHLLPEATFLRSGRTGIAQSAIGAARVRSWLDHFEAWEMAEFNSAPYFPIDLKGLTALFALAPDADIRQRAGSAILRLIEILARSAHHGVLTGAQGRSYEHTLRASRSLELSGIARLLWGKGNFGARFHTLPQLALCLRDYGLDVPKALAAIASVADDNAQEWTFAQGQDRIAKLYHYKTRAYALGSAAHYRWREWGYQETVLHARFGTNPDAQVWINHPGEVIHSGFGRPSYWGGSGTLPRVHQYRGLAVVLFDCAAEQPDFTHAWFPASVFDFSHVAKGVAVAASGDGMILLLGSGPFVSVETGPTAGNELRLPGHKSTWIVRMGARSTDGEPEIFAARFAGLALSGDETGELHITDPEYGGISFFADGRIAAEGRVIDPADWSVRGEAVHMSAGPRT